MLFELGSRTRSFVTSDPDLKVPDFELGIKMRSGASCAAGSATELMMILFELDKTWRSSVLVTSGAAFWCCRQT